MAVTDVSDDDVDQDDDNDRKTTNDETDYETRAYM